MEAQKVLPDECYDYNTVQGCSEEQCPRMHVCFMTILTGRCVRRACAREHQLNTPRNVALLEEMGWRGPDDLHTVLNGLRRRLRGRSISLCSAYTTGRCTVPACWKLHVCYRHVRDSCPLEDCPLSHDVKGGRHNAGILEAAGLTDTPLPELLSRLRDNLPTFRWMVCYNGWANGCERHCLRLHCCPDFLAGNCRFGDICCRTHSLRDPHNLRVLKFFGWAEQQVLSSHGDVHYDNRRQYPTGEDRLIDFLAQQHQREGEGAF